jgi:hypothetical protein
MKKALILSPMLSLLACEAPPVFATSQPAESTQLSNIQGNVVAQTHSRGNAIVFLFDAERPPPPVGSGLPLAFDVVPKDTLFGAEANDGTSVGPFAAPFAFSLVAPGNYLIEGFIDLDGCLPAPINCRTTGFIPWFNVTNEPNAGDVGGAAADPVTQQPTIVTIDPTTLAPVTDVTVAYTDLAEYTVDRPSFSVCIPQLDGTCPQVDAGTVFTPLPPSAANPVGGEVFEIDPTSVTVGSTVLQPLFLAKWADIDGGVPVDGDGDPQLGPDFWPKVIVRKLNSANPLSDENVDSRGLPLPNFVTYPHLDPTLDSQAAQVALTAFIPVTDVAPYLTDGTGQPILTPVPVPKLHIVVGPTATGPNGPLFPPAVDITNPAAPAPLTVLPAGIYGIYLIQFTGQAWRVPNELAPPFFQSLDFQENDSQAFILIVPDGGV